MSLERYSFSLCTLACSDSVDLFRRLGSTEIPMVRANLLLMPASCGETERAATCDNTALLSTATSLVTWLEPPLVLGSGLRDQQCHHLDSERCWTNVWNQYLGTGLLNSDSSTQEILLVTPLSNNLNFCLKANSCVPIYIPTLSEN